MPGNRQWILNRRPKGDIRDGDLVLKENPLPTAGAGRMVVRNQWLSLDPTNRVWMSDMDQYMPPVELGAPMRGFVMGKVVDGGTEALPNGSWVMGLGSWSDYSVEPASNFQAIPDVAGIERRDVFAQLAVVAPTAYFGLLDIGTPKIGETLVVSGAAGAVGSIAVQLGKAWGCKVVGIAGGAEKCGLVKSDYGADAVIDYKREDVKARLQALCPKGVDIYFDNVGVPTLTHVLSCMNLFGRVIQCGMISVYNSDGENSAPPNYALVLMKRLRVQGFVVLDSFSRYPEAFRAIATLRAQGRLKWRNHEVDGLENADKAVRMLYTGANTGKLLVRIADVA